MKNFLFIWALLAMVSTAATAQTDVETEKESYVGTIGTYDIVMDLEFWPDGQGGVFYSGTYYYESQGANKTIKLDGITAPYGTDILYERDPKTNKVSATFELTSPEFGKLEGTWKNTKGKEYKVFLTYPDMPIGEDGPSPAED